MEHRDTGIDARTTEHPVGYPLERARHALTPHRLDEIRRRLRDGAYDDRHVIDAVARRLLDSGEL